MKKTPAEEIRAAAVRLRETAEKTVRAPWAANGSWVIGANAHVTRFGHMPTRDWVVLASPALAEPLAAWLDAAAREITEHCAPGGTATEDMIRKSGVFFPTWPAALDAARAINPS